MRQNVDFIDISSFHPRAFVTRLHRLLIFGLSTSEREMDEAAGKTVELIFGRWRSQILYTRVTLGVVDALAGGARTAASAASELHVDAAALYRLMRAMSAVGILKEDDTHAFSLTSMGETLRENRPRDPMRRSLEAKHILAMRPMRWVPAARPVIAGMPGHLGHFPFTSPREHTMKSQKRLFAPMAIVSAIALFSSMLAWAAGQTPPSAPVTVVNTPSNPVPVTISGTSTVSGNVTITNPLLSAQTLNDVLDEPYHRSLSRAWSGNFPAFFNFPVPAGKRLIVESITARISGQPGVTGKVQYTVAGAADVEEGSGDIPLHRSASSSFPAGDDLLGATPLKLRVDAIPSGSFSGKELVFSLHPGDGSGTMNIAAFGRLVSLPN